ncbi:hypothetical protein F7725_020836 [Dissostichus mawsoni]|uniref:Uncharacterized protein n=1 Tax=Dissostichus mawsoni TaxID=36200 RepID=A0A7J5YHR0_DISMA|nr:hypothetical protein F7725_020836 [Dissostichus mawsoni]
MAAKICSRRFDLEQLLEENQWEAQVDKVVVVESQAAQNAKQELPFEGAVVGRPQLPEGVLHQVRASQGELEDRRGGGVWAVQPELFRTCQGQFMKETLHFL